MDSMLREVPGVCVYLDDILISGANDKEHLERLNSVLEVLSSRGLRLSKEKCSFSQTSVQYLGHVVDKNGLHPLAAKIKAISAAPPLKNVTEVKSFLGMLQFYSMFLKKPSYCDRAFNETVAKKTVCSIGGQVKSKHLTVPKRCFRVILC